jgi:hypothetical protein
VSELLRTLFINPQLLGLSALVAVPIIIYLINRHRYQRRKWAAMEFLLRALKKSQRRIQLQNLLLLLIRICIILFLVLAVARPVLRQRPLGIGSGGPQNWILVLDTSYSMGYREGALSLFDEAREMLRATVENLLQPDDRIALITLAVEPQILVGRSELKRPDTRQRLVRELEDAPLTSSGLRLVPSLRLLEQLAGEFSGPTGEPEPLTVLFFSDLQRKDWLEDEAPRSPEIKEILGRIEGRGGSFLVAKLSREETKLNVAITNLSVHKEPVAKDVPVEIRVTVHNPGEQVVENLDLTLRIDPELENEGAEAQLGEVLQRLAPGATVTRSLPFRFDSAGYHTVVAEVRSDGLVVDNSRYLVVHVAEEVGVLLVDGDPAADPLNRETFHLELVLEPHDDDAGALGRRYTPFQPHYITADQLTDIDWKRYAVVILANVAEVPAEELSRLERYVAEGGALMVFLGSNVQPGGYNEAFHREGAGLLPLRLGEVRGSDRTPVYLQFHDQAHPVARYFEQHQEETYLLRGIIPFYRYLRAIEPAGADAAAPPGLRVLCRFNDLEASPAIFDNPFGRGQVLWMTSSADTNWNEFPVWHDFVVFLGEAISYLVSFGSRSDNLLVGEVYEQFYEGTEFASEVLLQAPSHPGRGGADSLDPSGGGRTVRRSMVEIPDEKRFKITYEDTTVPGLYRLDLRRPNTQIGDSVQFFSVNVNTEESDLKAMTADDFKTHFEIKPGLFDAPERLRDVKQQKELQRGTEYWPWVAAALLLLLFLETALAQLFGRQKLGRRTA